MKAALFRRPALALALACSALTQADAATIGSPFAANRFSVEIDGVAVSQVLQVEFLKGDQADQADARKHAEKLPQTGLRAAVVLRLTRSLRAAPSETPILLKWRQAAAGGKVDRRTLRVSLLDAAFNDVAHIDLSECTALGWAGPDLFAQYDSKGVNESLDIGCASANLTGAN